MGNTKEKNEEDPKHNWFDSMPMISRVPLSSSMLPPPLIDRLLGFFDTTFDDFWVPRCRETVRNASRAAALNIVEEGGAFVSFFFAL